MPRSYQPARSLILRKLGLHGARRWFRFGAWLLLGAVLAGIMLPTLAKVKAKPQIPNKRDSNAY